MARDPAARVAAGVTRYTDTVDIAGVALQVSCRFPKPRFWARRHPEFATARRPDVVVRIDYDDDFWRATRRPPAHTVADAPRVRRHGRALLVSAGYYRAVVDLARGRAVLRMAAGFDVAGLLRTLAALWLLERHTLLLRGSCVGPEAAATLVCGVDDGAGGAETTAASATGWLAVTPRPESVIAQPTPFGEGAEPSVAPRVRRVTTLVVPGAAPGQRLLTDAGALRALLPWIWQADRRRAGVERTLDLSARIVAALTCHEVGVAAREPAEVAVG